MKTLAIATLILQFTNFNEPMGVYGQDDRIEALTAPEHLQNLVSAVAAQVPKRFVSVDDNGHYFDSKYSIYNSIYIDDLSTALPLCSDVKFKGQKTYAGCTAFLIAPDKLLTAGHCTTSRDYCEKNYWVFDYVDSDQTRISSENIYNCSSVDNLEYQSDRRMDYAVITLDREVKSRKPLTIDDSYVDVGQSMTVAGFPTGLPMKIDSNAKVVRNESGFFYMSADTFAGNSGSPVINPETGGVVGILSSGAEDYTVDMTNRCVRISNHNEKYGNEAVFKLATADLFYLW